VAHCLAVIVRPGKVERMAQKECERLKAQKQHTVLDSFR
jgi:hypothetical protein